MQSIQIQLRIMLRYMKSRNGRYHFHKKKKKLCWATMTNRAATNGKHRYHNTVICMYI